MRMINMTPTWEEILPSIRAVLENNKSPEARESMWGELKRMAQTADRWNAHCDATKEAEPVEAM